MESKIKNLNGLIVIFLTERTVFVDRNISSPDPLYCGVSKGSILGPLLFIIFINNLNDYIEQTSVIM